MMMRLRLTEGDCGSQKWVLKRIWKWARKYIRQDNSNAYMVFGGLGGLDSCLWRIAFWTRQVILHLHIYHKKPQNPRRISSPPSVGLPTLTSTSLLPRSITIVNNV